MSDLELTKALVFREGKVQRLADADRLTVGAGIEPAETAQGKPASIAVGASLQFDLTAGGLPQHQVKNAELLLNRLASAPNSLSSYGKLYALADEDADTTSTSKLFFLDDEGTSHFLQNDGLLELTEPAQGSLLVDFDPSLPVMRSILLTKATDFATVAASLKPGRAVSLRVKNNTAEALDVTFPLNGDAQRWTWLGGTTPTTIPAGQESILSLVSLGTTNDSILAGFSYNDSEQVTGQGTPDYLAVFENARDIRSAFLYLYEEDTNSDSVADYTRLGIGRAFGPETTSDNQPTGLITPAASLHVHSNKAGAEEAIAKFQSTNAAFKLFALNAAPEGVVTGSAGDLASDSTNGSLYFKSAGTDTNTGWQQLAFETKFFTVNAGSALAANEACFFVDNANDIVDQAKANATSASKYKEARFAGLVASVVSGKAEIRMSGLFAGASFVSGSVLKAGDPVYLSKTAGKLTNDVSGFVAGDVVAEIGVISKAISSTSADVVIQPKAVVVL